MGDGEWVIVMGGWAGDCDGGWAGDGWVGE